jgi:hypothetical protein
LGQLVIVLTVANEVLERVGAGSQPALTSAKKLSRQVATAWQWLDEDRPLVRRGPLQPGPGMDAEFTRDFRRNGDLIGIGHNGRHEDEC